MFIRKRVTQVKRRHCRYRSRRFCSLSVKDGLQFLSSLILPLMLGVFTVVITFQQQKVARDQRIEDMNSVQQQRLEDKNNSRLQREQDWNISQIAQEAQSKTISEQYRDEVLVAYIKEIGDLLKEYNGSLTSDSLTHTLARVKTLNTIRQLDGSRQIHVIRFLYEAGQLTNSNESIALDISTAELIDIDFHKSGRLLRAGSISLAGAYLVNSTFSDISLKNVNFSSAELSNLNFSFADLNDVNFSAAILGNVNFSFASLYNVNFSSVHLVNSKFSSAYLGNINFASAWLKNINFSSALLMNVNFSSAQLENVNFSCYLLTHFNFSFASLNNVNFSSVRLSYTNFSSARLAHVNFSSAQLDNVNFSSARLYNVNFSSVQLSYIWGLTNFDHADMADTIFLKCLCESVDFSYANLKGSTFHGARLRDANFSLANLDGADFTNTTITSSQLQSALSIRNAKLPNGTLGQGRNLVKNGDTNCNIPLVDHWKVQNGNITGMPSKEDRGECRFTLQSVATGAIMFQRIFLIGIWDSSFWTYSHVELQARISSGVSIQLSGKNNKSMVLNKEITNSSENKIIMLLEKDTQELEVEVKFNAHNNKYNNDNIWCDNIELFIDYET